MFFQHGCLSKAHASKVLPLVFSAIHKRAQRKLPVPRIFSRCYGACFPSLRVSSTFADHWNPTVHSLAEGVLKHYSDRDPELYDRCLATVSKEEDLAAALKEKRKQQWESLMKLSA